MWNQLFPRRLQSATCDPTRSVPPRRSRGRDTVYLVATLFVSLFITTSLTAQIEQTEPSSAPETQASDHLSSAAAAERPELSRKLKIATNSQTLNYIPKFDGAGTGTVSDSVMYENAGNVGMNTTDPKAKLHLYSPPTSDIFLGMGFDPSGATGSALNIGYGGFSFGRAAGFINVRPDPLAVAPNPSLRLATANVVRLLIDNQGFIGIGTAAPLEKLHVFGNMAIDNPDLTSYVGFKLNAAGGVHGGGLYAMGTNYTAQPNTANDAGTVALMSYETGGISLTSGNTTNGSIRMYTAGSSGGTERLRITHAGNVGIGIAAPTAKLHVNGNVIATGSITGATVLGAVYQDVAEWVPASSDMAPGTVVVLNLERTNEVMPSSRRYDTAVAGVVSAAPGILLGVAGDAKEQIATTGRVKVRVDARRAPVHVGDLLVTSDLAGTAMRSEPMNINGRQFHQPGTIIGKALEALDDGVGEVLVLLSMQ